ncbi:MAG: site-specific integrase [Gammaproteobacteria bacterium]
MARKRHSGLRKRGAYWHIEKHINGRRIYESTGETDYRRAQAYYERRIPNIRRIVAESSRPKVTFKEAAEKFLKSDCPAKSLERAGYAFQHILSFIGHLELECVHDGSLTMFKEWRQEAGVSAGTINKELGFIRRVLILAARKWRHYDGQRYLSEAPLIEKAKGAVRKAYPLEWREQTQLFSELPAHLERMALFDVNTGLRSAEVCALRWHWEVKVPELDTYVFLLPAEMTKNGEERIVVLNRIAKGVVESERGRHPTYVFSYKGKRLVRMNNHAWRKARIRAGLPQVRVHDLRHTFGHRLRASGVSFEDRQDLLGHSSGRITTHYSAPDIVRLLQAVELICEQNRMTILRLAAVADDNYGNSGKTPFRQKAVL